MQEGKFAPWGHLAVAGDFFGGGGWRGKGWVLLRSIGRRRDTAHHGTQNKMIPILQALKRNSQPKDTLLWGKKERESVKEVLCWNIEGPQTLLPPGLGV